MFFFWYNKKILEITIDNCQKCHLETIIDPNNSQYFWVNRRDLEIERRKSEEIFKEEKIFTQHDVENKQLKEEKEQLRKENEQLRKNNKVKDATIKESKKKPMEIKILKEDKNMTDYHPNWFDKNEFQKMLAIIDSGKFNYKNKISEFKCIDIKDLVNNIRNITISEIPAKEGLNVLNRIKNAEIIKKEKVHL